MKKLTITITLITFLTLASNAYALTPAPTTPSSISPTQQAINEKLNTQINQLKDKIASRVSELNLVEKKGVIGTISEISTNKVTLTDIQGETKQIDIDEITKFSSASVKGTFGLSDLTKGTRVSVLGLYNKQSKRILARFISTSVDPIFLSGAISEIDTKNITFTITDEDKKKIKIDVVPTTKILSYAKDGLPVKTVFAKLNVGDRIKTVGFPDKTDSSLIVSERVGVFPDLPKNPKISITIPSPTEVPTVAPTAVLQRRVAPPVIRR